VLELFLLLVRERWDVVGLVRSSSQNIMVPAPWVIATLHLSRSPDSQTFFNSEVLLELLLAAQMGVATDEVGNPFLNTRLIKLWTVVSAAEDILRVFLEV